MNDGFIPVNKPLLDGNEKKYLNECIDTGWISSEGPFVDRFEKDFAARVGCKYGVAVANGSVALDAAVVVRTHENRQELVAARYRFNHRVKLPDRMTAGNLVS